MVFTVALYFLQKSQSLSLFIKLYELDFILDLGKLGIKYFQLFIHHLKLVFL